MVNATTAEATPLHRALPEEIVIWEILVLLPPKSLLRCRAVCRAWRCATSTREFLLAHHGRQPSLPLTAISTIDGRNILSFDHRATADAQLHTIARLDWGFELTASCGGLLTLTRFLNTQASLFICNPVTRQYAPLGRMQGLTILGMYLHRPTGEYRLLLCRWNNMTWSQIDLLPEGQTGCYVLVLGSNEPPRYLVTPKAGSELCVTPTLVHDNLHWFTMEHRTQRKLLIVFDTIAELFRQMHAPIVPVESKIFEMDGTLGIYTSNINTSKIVDIWVLQNYESEIWHLKYRIDLPVAEIRERFECHEYLWKMTVVSGNGDFLLHVSVGPWLLYVDRDGKLVASFHEDIRHLCVFKFRLKQILVPHNLFTALDGHVVNPSPFG